MNWFIKQIAKITLLGKLVEKLGPKVPIIFIFISLIFAAFYIPYEYENILEFQLKYPNDVVGFTLNLARPTIIILILLILIFSAFSAVNERKRQLEKEEQEQKQKEAEALAKRQEALKKLEELKKSPVAKTAEAVVTKKSIGTLGGAAIGATLGGSLGIAGKFLGVMVFINGAWVLAPVGGILGYFAAKKIAKKKKRNQSTKKIKSMEKRLIKKLETNNEI